MSVNEPVASSLSDNLLSAFSGSNEFSKPDRRRYRVLVIFCLVSFNIGFCWIAFANVPRVAHGLFPALTDEALAWTLNANNLGQVAATPFAIWLQQKPRKGLRYSVIGAALAQFTQASLWAIASLCEMSHPLPAAAVLLTLLIGGASGGVACALTQGVVSKLSVMWFPPPSRGLATAIAFGSQYFGFAGSYTASLLLICTPADLRTQLICQALVAFALLVVAWLAFPEMPRNHHHHHHHRGHSSSSSSSSSAAAPPPSPSSWSVVRDTWHRFERRQLSSALLLCMAIALINGLFSAYQTTLPLVYTDPSAGAAGPKCPPGKGAWARVISARGVVLSLAAGLTYPAGSVLSGLVMDLKSCRQRLQLLQAIALVMLVVIFWFAMRLDKADATPPFAPYPPPAAPPPLPPPGNTTAGGDNGDAAELAPLLLLVGGAGLAAGWTMPAGMELLAEIGYPYITEGVSANVTMLLIQAAETALTAVAALLSPEQVNIVMLCGAAGAILFLVPVDARYRRAAARGERQPTGPIRDALPPLGVESPVKDGTLDGPLN